MKKKVNTWETIYSKNKNYRTLYPYDEVVTFIYQNIEKKRNIKILELGCGTGNNVIFFSEIGFDVYGIDMSKTAIDYCKKRLKEKNLKADIKVKNIEKYKFKKNFFDFIIDRSSLTCLNPKQLELIVKKVHTSLKKGGMFFFTPHSDESTRYDGRVSDEGTYVPKYLPFGEIDRRNLSFSFLNKKDIYQLFKKKYWSIKNLYIKKNLDLKSKFCHAYFQVEVTKNE